MKKPSKKVIIIGLSVILVVSVIFVVTRKKKSVETKVDDNAPKKKVLTKGINVNLRSAPSTSSSVVKNISDSITVIGTMEAVANDSDSTKKADGSIYTWIKVTPVSSLGIGESFYIREDLATIQ